MKPHRHHVFARELLILALVLAAGLAWLVIGPTVMRGLR